jgi:transglutaminase-like putative cysteine protease
MKVYLTRFLTCLLLSVLYISSGTHHANASAFNRLDKVPLNEQWFGIYIDKDLVGFYSQKFNETANGYRIETSSNVRMKVMGFSKEATARETYFVTRNLALRSFDVEHSLNGVLSRITGTRYDTSMRIKVESNGKSTEKNFTKLSGDIFPGPVLNIYPLMRSAAIGKSYKISTFDPEEQKIKDVKISILSHETSPNGVFSVKLRNNLYPFVNNDIWVDALGNTLWESVRDGLVVTRAEDPKSLAAFVSNVAISRKDLIYDFSLVRAEPPVKDVARLTGLSVEISGWNDSLPLLQGGGQLAVKSGEGRIIIHTGTAVPAEVNLKPVHSSDISDSYLRPAEKIESDDPKIRAHASEITKDISNPAEMAKALSAWTSAWLKDSVDDGGSAVSSLKSRYGNCQTHARLYTALARAANIPTRIVSGLVAFEDKGFLYHSWAESLLNGKWVAVDPTYNQMPADPTHFKFFEGGSTEDLSPIIAIIGKIRLTVKETRYRPD